MYTSKYARNFLPRIHVPLSFGYVLVLLTHYFSITAKQLLELRKIDVIEENVFIQRIFKELKDFFNKILINVVRA